MRRSCKHSGRRCAKMEKTEALRRTLLSQFYRKNRFALSVAVFSALLSGTLICALIPSRAR